jgi:hypothetical protein
MVGKVACNSRHYDCLRCGGATPVFAALQNSSIRPLERRSAAMNNEGILRKGQARCAKVSMFGVCGGASVHVPRVHGSKGGGLGATYEHNVTEQACSCT